MQLIQNKKDNYQIISLIGQGAYGQVFKARKKLTGQFVAIKSIKKKGKAEKDIKSMREQIEILKKLKHQNIILLLDSFQNSHEFILVTQLGQGQLFNIIEDDQIIDIEEIRKIAQQLVRALHYIHSNRITHRDMKPQNILMTSDGVIKLCDFGFARSMSYKTQVLTSLKGTPLYMAPQVVKEEPYNHTADLWSLGVILYELATGNPPFTAPNLISLVDRITKDPINFPESIGGDFRHFLKGLLNKDPKKRLAWPQLLHHPFIKQTQIQKTQRKRKTERISSWIQDNVIVNQEQGQRNESQITSKYVPGGSFDGNDQNYFTPKKGKKVDNTNDKNAKNNQRWRKYFSIAQERQGCHQLRQDRNFLQFTLTTLETGINDIIRINECRINLHICVKTLNNLMVVGDPYKPKNVDLMKNFNVTSSSLNILKCLLRIELSKQYPDIIGEFIKLIGLLGSLMFKKELGIEMIFIREFIPLFPLILKSIYHSKSQKCITNFLRTFGMFSNNASCNHIRSFSFYKDIVEIKVIPDSMEIFKHFQDNQSVLSLYMQLLSAIIHPVFGDIECFPWNKSESSGVAEFKEFITMSECIRQYIINPLLEGTWVGFFQKMLRVEEQKELQELSQIAIMRIILQSIRLSKQFTEMLLGNKPIMKKIIKQLSNKDLTFYSTACCILVQCVKYIKQKSLENNVIYKQLDFIVQQIQDCLKYYLNQQAPKGKDFNVKMFASFLLLYEILALPNSQINNTIITFMNKEKVFQLFTALISEPQKNKLQEMRIIEGSNFGIHTLGIYDSCFMLLHRLYLKITKQSNPQLTNLLTKNILKSKISSKISNLVKTLSSKTDISPRGFISCLIFIGNMINLGVVEDFSEQKFIKSLVCLLKKSQIYAIIQWPEIFGGGMNCLTILFGNLSIIILSLVKDGQKYPLIPKYLYDSDLVKNIVQLAFRLEKENISSVISIFNHLLALDKIEKNDNVEQTFSYQFVNADGMDLFSHFQLLNKQIYDPSALIESCNFLSLLAKASKYFYQYINANNLLEKLPQLLDHPDAQLRAKVLNFIGNLCRHSSFFYKKLFDLGILKQCIKLCQDQDKIVKRFACVVLGNASFHDSSLYEVLQPTILILANLVKDTQEKTRLNAVAALGNYARNSQMLDKDLVKNGVNEQLINLVLNEKSVSCKKVCVMAMTNLLSLPESRKILQSQNIENILKKHLPPAYSGDSSLIKACQKALQKLDKKIE